MARPTSLSDFKSRCRQRANMENSGFVDDVELIGYINESISDLYDLLIQKYGEDYYTKPAPYSLNVSGSQNQYNLPTDFFKVRGVDLNLGTNEAISIKQFSMAERNKYRNNYIFSWDQEGVSRARYRIIGRKIWFLPNPSGSASIDIWYIPLAPVLEDDSDEFDAINGWEEYIIVDTAIKMLSKEESDTSALELRMAKLTNRIETAANNRDAANPMKISDVNSSYDSEFGSGVY